MGAHNVLDEIKRADDGALSGTDLDMANLDVKVKTVVQGTGTIGTQGAALTAQSTTLTHTAPGTPDFAIAALTQTTPFGFVASDEGHTVLQVIANLQVRLAEVEARLEAAGIIVAN